MPPHPPPSPSTTISIEVSSGLALDPIKSAIMVLGGFINSPTAFKRIILYCWHKSVNSLPWCIMSTLSILVLNSKQLNCVNVSWEVSGISKIFTDCRLIMVC